MHFKGLMLQDLLERQLLNAAKQMDPKEVEAAVKHAVDAFLRIYGTEEPKPEGSGQAPRARGARVIRGVIATRASRPRPLANGSSPSFATVHGNIA